MATHRIGTREEWLTARLALLEAEKELTHRGDVVAQARRVRRPLTAAVTMRNCTSRSRGFVPQHVDRDDAPVAVALWRYEQSLP